MSVPCTPDSYGYCAVLTYNNVTKVTCPRGSYALGYFTGERDYEIYNTTTDLGSATQTLSGSCADGQSIDWSPGDPSVTYGDPNLP